MHVLPALALLVGFVPYETPGGTPLHWPTDVTTVVLVDRDPPAELPAADVLHVTADALAKWLDSDCTREGPILDHRPRFAPPALADAVLSEDDHNVALVWIDRASDWSALGFGSLELARTAVINRVSSGEIVDADIAVNVGGFDFAVTPACPTVYDLESTITHELGHVMGLDHSPVASATMAAKANAGECDKRALDPDDEAGFCATYTEPRPPEAEPGPEPEPRPEVVEAEPDIGKRDDGCSSTPTSTTMVVLLAMLSARRASAPRRRSRRPSRAR